MNNIEEAREVQKGEKTSKGIEIPEGFLDMDGYYFNPDTYKLMFPDGKIYQTSPLSEELQKGFDLYNDVVEGKITYKEAFGEE